MRRALRLSALVLVLASCAHSTTERLNLPPLEAVPKVELERYLGTWYEIASYPEWFAKGCTATSATYSTKPDGNIDVLNRCRKESITGPEDIAHGTARVVDTTTNAKLEVSFFGPFWGDYWVIDLGPSYEYAVVGSPTRDHVWILSRTRQLPESTYATILQRLTASGHEVSRLQLTAQPLP